MEIRVFVNSGMARCQLAEWSHPTQVGLSSNPVISKITEHLSTVNYLEETKIAIKVYDECRIKN